MTRWRAEDIPADVRSRIADDVWHRGVSRKAPEHRSKYRNKIIYIDGLRFHSKLEAQHYEQLKLAKAGGLIRAFLRQVPFHLPGGVKHFVDWMVLYEGREPVFAESKGSDLPMGRLKRKQVQELYGVKIVMWGLPEITL